MRRCSFSIWLLIVELFLVFDLSATSSHEKLSSPWKASQGSETKKVKRSNGNFDEFVETNEDLLPFEAPQRIWEMCSVAAEPEACMLEAVNEESRTFWIMFLENLRRTYCNSRTSRLCLFLDSLSRGISTTEAEADDERARDDDTWYPQQSATQPVNWIHNKLRKQYVEGWYRTPDSLQEYAEDQFAIPKKKNVFTSRGWGAGGMPFSVLYMNKQKPKIISSVPQPRAEMAPTPAPLRREPPHHRHTQVGLRNAVGLRRKQYPIIPQLFVSYGWGPLGK